MRENLGSIPWEESLEKGKATHSSILAWRTPWTVFSPWGRKKSDTTEQLSLHFFSKLAFIFKLERSLFLTGLICKVVKYLKSPFFFFFNFLFYIGVLELDLFQNPLP